jgi:hypothetical protein
MFPIAGGERTSFPPIFFNSVEPHSSLELDLGSIQVLDFPENRFILDILTQAGVRHGKILQTGSGIKKALGVREKIGDLDYCFLLPPGTTRSEWEQICFNLQSALVNQKRSIVVHTSDFQSPFRLIRVLPHRRGGYRIDLTVLIDQGKSRQRCKFDVALNLITHKLELQLFNSDAPPTLDEVLVALKRPVDEVLNPALLPLNNLFYFLRERNLGRFQPNVLLHLIKVFLNTKPNSRYRWFCDKLEKNVQEARMQVANLALACLEPGLSAEEISALLQICKKWGESHPLLAFEEQLEHQVRANQIIKDLRNTANYLTSQDFSTSSFLVQSEKIVSEGEFEGLGPVSQLKFWRSDLHLVIPRGVSTVRVIETSSPQLSEPPPETISSCSLPSVEAEDVLGNELKALEEQKAFRENLIQDLREKWQQSRMPKRERSSKERKLSTDPSEEAPIEVKGVEIEELPKDSGWFEMIQRVRLAKSPKELLDFPKWLDQIQDQFEELWMESKPFTCLVETLFRKMLELIKRAGNRDLGAPEELLHQFLQDLARRGYDSKELALQERIRELFQSISKRKIRENDLNLIKQERRIFYIRHFQNERDGSIREKIAKARGDLEIVQALRELENILKSDFLLGDPDLAQAFENIVAQLRGSRIKGLLAKKLMPILIRTTLFSLADQNLATKLYELLWTTNLKELWPNDLEWKARMNILFWASEVSGDVALCSYKEWVDVFNGVRAWREAEKKKVVPRIGYFPHWLILASLLTELKPFLRGAMMDVFFHRSVDEKWTMAEKRHFSKIVVLLRELNHGKEAFNWQFSESHFPKIDPLEIQNRGSLKTDIELAMKSVGSQVERPSFNEFFEDPRFDFLPKRQSISIGKIALFAIPLFALMALYLLRK